MHSRGKTPEREQACNIMSRSLYRKIFMKASIRRTAKITFVISVGVAAFCGIISSLYISSSTYKVTYAARHGIPERQHPINTISWKNQDGKGKSLSGASSSWVITNNLTNSRVGILTENSNGIRGKGDAVRHVPDRLRNLKYLIYTCDTSHPCGVWGQRQSAIMATYLLSVVTNRTFGINITAPCSFQKFFKSNNVNWLIEEAGVSGLSKRFLYKLTEGNLQTLARVNFNHLFREDVLYVTHNWSLERMVSVLIRNPLYHADILISGVLKMTPPERFLSIWSKLFRNDEHVERKVLKFITKAKHRTVADQPHDGQQANRLVCAQVPDNVNNHANNMNTLEKFTEHYRKKHGNDFTLIIDRAFNTTRNYLQRRLSPSSVYDLHDVNHLYGRTVDSCSTYSQPIISQQIMTHCDVLLAREDSFGTNTAYLRVSASDLFCFRNEDISPGYCKLSYVNSAKISDDPQRVKKYSSLQTKKQKYLIYYCDSSHHCGGWSDRQKAMLAIYMIAIVTDRKYGINMTAPCPLTKFYKPHLFKWEIKDSEIAGLSKRYLFKFVDGDFLQSLSKIDFNSKYPEDVVYLMFNWRMQQVLHQLSRNPFYLHSLSKQPILNMTDAQRFRLLWNTFFTVDEKLEQKTIDFVEKARVGHNNIRHNKTLVCAHMRIGKNPTVPDDWFVKNPVDNITSFWNFVDEYTKNDSKRFSLFVATDSDEVRRRSHLFFPGLAVDPGGEIGHIDQLKANQTNGCDIFEKSLLDQNILTHCDALVMSGSLFGGNAAHLRENSKETYCYDKEKVARGYCLDFEGQKISV